MKKYTFRAENQHKELKLQKRKEYSWKRVTNMKIMLPVRLNTKCTRFFHDATLRNMFNCYSLPRNITNILHVIIQFEFALFIPDGKFFTNWWWGLFKNLKWIIYNRHRIIQHDIEACAWHFYFARQIFKWLRNLVR